MKKKLTNLSLVLISICLALLLGEVVVRIFMPQTLQYRNEGIWKPDPILGWRHQANINLIANFGEAEITFRTDQHGYRINADPEVGSDTSHQNILVLGDSFLEAVQVENREATARILQRKLNALPGINTSFYNSAVAGWNPNHYLLESRRVLEETQLEIDQAIVFLYLGNDVVPKEVERFDAKERIGRRAFRMPRSFSRREFVWGVLFPAGDYLDRNSHLYMLIKKRNRRALIRLGLSSASFPAAFQTKFDEAKAWTVTTGICKKIHKEFEKYDVPVRFVLIPTNYQVDQQLMEEYTEDFGLATDSIDIEQPNKILAGLFARDSMVLYDPLDYLRRKNAVGLQLYGITDPHFNAEGHKVLAEYLLPILSEELK